MGCCISMKISRISSFESVSGFSRKAAKPNNVSKILILGTSNSGKSTLFRQMQIINTAGFSELERQSYKKIITDNVIDCISMLLREAKTTWRPSNPKDLDMIVQFQDLASGDRWNLSHSEEAKLLHISQQLWKIPMMKMIFEEFRGELECPESIAFLLNTISNLASENGLPTDQQILHSRLKTSGCDPYTLATRTLSFN